MTSVSSALLSWRGSSASSTAGMPRLRAAAADLAHESRKAIVGDDGVGIGDQRRRHRRGRAAVKALVAKVRDRALAAAVDARSPRSTRGRPSTRGQSTQSIFSCAASRQERVADRVDARRAAERSGEARARAEMRDRDRGIRRVAAVDRCGMRSPASSRPAAGKCVDAEHQVEHRDAGAQHMLACVSAKTPSPSSTQARMM